MLSRTNHIGLTLTQRLHKYIPTLAQHCPIQTCWANRWPLYTYSLRRHCLPTLVHALLNRITRFETSNSIRGNITVFRGVFKFDNFYSITISKLIRSTFLRFLASNSAPSMCTTPYSLMCTWARWHWYSNKKGNIFSIANNINAKNKVIYDQTFSLIDNLIYIISKTCSFFHLFILKHHKYILI